MLITLLIYFLGNGLVVFTKSIKNEMKIELSDESDNKEDSKEENQLIPFGSKINVINSQLYIVRSSIDEFRYSDDISHYIRNIYLPPPEVKT